MLRRSHKEAGEPAVIERADAVIPVRATVDVARAEGRIVGDFDHSLVGETVRLRHGGDELDLIIITAVDGRFLIASRRGRT